VRRQDHRESTEERAYALVRHGINKPSQLSEHLLGITSRSGAEVGILELPLLAPADALHDQLGPVVIELHRAPHLHDIVISRARLEYAPTVRNPTQPPVLAGEPDAIYALPEGGVMVASGNGYRVAKRNLSASVKR